MYIAVEYIHIAYVKLLLKSYHTTDTLHSQKLFLHILFMSIIQKKCSHDGLNVMSSNKRLYDVQEQLDNVQFALHLNEGL
jgi:hypothetical protein